MKLSSPRIAFDNRLLAIEEQFRQRKYTVALRELSELSESDFETQAYDVGLYLSLAADAGFHEGNYKNSIEFGLRSARVLAGFPSNRRFGRVQLILAKSYLGLGDIKNADMRARDALASFRRASDVVGQVDSFNQLAYVSYIRCDYHAAIKFLEDAAGMLDDNPRKIAQLTGNMGTMRVHVGQWAQAEAELNSALKANTELGFETAQAINLLSLGFLALKRRQFKESRRNFDTAMELIDRQDRKREKVIALKYSAELALEKGDVFQSKALAINAYQSGLLLAPDSALVSQAARRLADVELALDNLDDAMKYGQKALDLATTLGELTEVGLARRVIARVYATRSEYDEALENIKNAVEDIRSVDDPFELARTLLWSASLMIEANSDDDRKIRSTFDEAHRLFRKLGSEYWVAETNFKAGMFACQRGDLSTGFKKLSRAEKRFAALGEKARVRSVNIFLQSLSDQAVALSISQENEFKIFGNLISPDELSDLKTSQLAEILSVLLRKTGADRAVIYTPDYESDPVIATLSLSKHQVNKFCQNFKSLLDEEISRNKPTLNLDCRRDPFINDLLADIPDVVASMIVVPFRMTDGIVSYLYVDRLTNDGTLRPFDQKTLNFAVGFSDLIAFKWAEILKNKLLEDNRRLKDQLREQAAFPNIITQNEQMLEMLSQVRQVLNSNISITIEGETGTGKDLLARAIHYNSIRREKRFVSVNCAALPETLLESELFGFVRGAFTGADRDKSGLFEEADGGTFFLDEIADMPLSVQAKILRVLESKEIVRLGDTKPRSVDVRIVSATNKDLKTQMDAGLFRQDLYYRLSALSFRLSPLRERKGDIPLLVAHFLEGSNKQIDPSVMKFLVAHDWPGNIRELDNEIKKLILLVGDNDVITPEVVSPQLRSATGSVGTQSGTSEISLDEVEFSSSYSLYDYLSEYERRFIIRALREKRGVKKHAAAMLNIPESTLRLKIKQYGIDPKHLSRLH
ncbi:MAG: sigma 54-interacting transcriptional regulator [candidate division Zixibacteria bacterium]|nr:sigma 54-interacting transcriptional regulator [candidate division Zixibacteria bacterium]